MVYNTQILRLAASIPRGRRLAALDAAGAVWSAQQGMAWKIHRTGKDLRC